MSLSTFFLLVAEDAAVVACESHATDTGRADSLDKLLRANHGDEIDEPAPADVVTAGTEAVVEWYSTERLVDWGVDVHYETLEINPIAQPTPTRRTGLLVKWEVDDTDDSADPFEAAARVWRDIFDRTEANPDDACTFTVVGPDGTETFVDLGTIDYPALCARIDTIDQLGRNPQE